MKAIICPNCGEEIEAEASLREQLKFARYTCEKQEEIIKMYEEKHGK